MGNTEIVTLEQADRISWVRMSRPERRNALNHAAVEQLHSAVERAAQDNSRVLVISGDAGHFCAGADLKELEDLEFTRALRAALDDLAALEFPTIAAISGSCLGLGLQIALSCDLRVCTADSRFAVPVAKLGLMVDHWTVRRLAMLAGQSTARWMMLTAEPVGAQRAAEIGLIQELITDDLSGGSTEVVDRRCGELAENIAQLAPLALSGTKAGLDALEWQVNDEVPYEVAFERAWASEDLVEGRRAFDERRKPEFRGR